MKTHVFPGGVHPRRPSEGKPAAEKAIRIMPAPDRVVIPMLRVTGAQLSPLVKRGDFVRLGQKIGDSDKVNSAPIHASVSGKVIAVEARPHPSGRRAVPAVVIENDHQESWDESCAPPENPDDLSGEEIARIAREKGVVGLGGATFPTHIKLSPSKPADVLILNGAECEPLLSADYRLMVERADVVIDGALFAKRSVGAKRVYVGIESDSPEAIRAISAAAKGADIEVVPLSTRYPQGGERQLIYTLTGRKLSMADLPSDAGCALINVGTAAALHRAVREGRPLIDRVITVAGGAVREPANVLARIGTSVRDLIEYCGGYREGGAGKLIAGGPMMGVALASDAVPVIAGTSGVLALTEGEAVVPEPGACMRCGRCHRVCPMSLQPYAIDAAIAVHDLGLAARFNAHECIECGACVYICPARRHLLQNIRLAKTLVRGSAAPK
jgi:electron transport complex protein RnfC